MPPFMTALRKKPTLRRIWATTYREDYPADAEPYGFVTLTDLRHGRGAGPPHDTFSPDGGRQGWPWTVDRPADEVPPNRHDASPPPFGMRRRGLTSGGYTTGYGFTWASLRVPGSRMACSRE
jgi:hypothetical protein